MNQRQRKLLLYLLSQKHYQPIQELCGEFGFSEKTIRNDIKAINAYLHMNEVTSRIQIKRGSGVRMHLMEREEEYVRYLLIQGFGNQAGFGQVLSRYDLTAVSTGAVHDGYACR